MYVVTFYSYKGGVGRTLALLNVAYELADSGLSVLVVDFDLEAPGIHPGRWRNEAEHGTGTIGQASADPGVVEYVGRYMDTMRVPTVEDFIVDATPEGCGGRIAVMPSGVVDESYRMRLNAIDWNDLYRLRDGYVMFEDTRAQWRALGYDYVVLDSRTGFTDVGGICTRHLPDAVVTLFRPDDQSLAGTQGVVEAIRAEGPTPRRRQAIELHFVMAGIPDADDEHGILAERRRVFGRRLGIGGVGQLLEVRHYPSMDLLTQPIHTRFRPGTRLADSYRDLTRRIRAGNVEDKPGIIEGLRDRRLLGPDFGFLHRIRRRYDSDAGILAQLADAYVSAGDIVAAAELLERTAELKPLTGRQLWRLAGMLRMLRDPRGAKDALRSFFQETRHSQLEEDHDGGYLVVRVLGLLETLVEDGTEFVSGSPVVAALPVAARAAVASRLNRTVGESRVAVEILDELLADDQGSSRQQADWAWYLAFARVAAGDSERAREFFSSALANPATHPPVQAAFNLAMTEWAAAGTPVRETFARVVREMDAMDDRTWLDNDANSLQAVAVACWFGGRPEEAGERLDEAERAAGRREISCWSYTRVPRQTFLNHCAEIRRLFAGECLEPEFMRRR